MDGAGGVYVVDDLDSRVLKLAAGASTPAVLPCAGLRNVYGVAVDGAGTVYVTDGGNSRVLKLAPGASAATELPFTGLGYPEGVALDGAGDVYVTTRVVDAGNGLTGSNLVLKLARHAFGL